MSNRSTATDTGHRARREIADFWDAHLEQWLAGRRDDPDQWEAPLPKWFRSYRGKVDLGQYPDPYIGDLRGVRAEPRLVFLGLNPGIGYDELQGHKGTWTERIDQEGYSHCFARSPEDDPENWLRVHRKRSPYWANIIRFARRWLDDDQAGMQDILNFELYPWHSANIQARMDPPPEVLARFVWAPVQETDVSAVFAFGAKWFDICEALRLPEVVYYGPGVGLVPGSDMDHWRLGLYRLSSGQLVVVSSQKGYAGPPKVGRVELIRGLVAQHR